MRRRLEGGQRSGSAGAERGVQAVTGTASTLPGPALGFDCLAPVSQAVAQAFWDDHWSPCRVCERYVETMSVDEAAMLHGIGYAIVPISEAMVSVPLGASEGRQRAAQVLLHAARLGIPRGVHITIDLEAVPAGSNASEYASAFATSLQVGGYGAMLYVGAGCGLNGAELWALPTDRYWRAGNVELPEPRCGYCANQHLKLDRVVHGQQVDYDSFDCDALGRQPVLWMP
jgi:hypothetical protein